MYFEDNYIFQQKGRSQYKDRDWQSLWKDLDKIGQSDAEEDRKWGEKNKSGDFVLDCPS